MQETITKLEKETDDLNAELSKARNEQQRERTEMVNIINERDELKMEHFKCETKTQELEAKRQELENKTQELEVKTQELIVKLSKCEANQQNLENKIANSSKFNSFNINCDFVDISKAYTCVTRDLFIYYKDMELNEVTGTHLMSNKNINVTELIIANSSVLFWANDIFKAFPTLQTLEIHNAQLKELSKGDFYSATKVTVLKVQENEMKFLGDNVFEGAEEHLTKIYMNSNQIEKVSSGTFHGLKHLKLLSLKDNLITELKLGSFKDVVMLENLILTRNKIKFLNGKLFEYNVKLMTLAVDHNELREVGEEILNYSVVLRNVDFNGNDCIYNEFKVSEVHELKFNIKHCCKNPAEALKVYNCGHKGWEN